MDIDPAMLLNAGGLALFATAVLWEIRKLGPAMAKIAECLTRLEERTRDVELDLAPRRIRTPPRGARIRDPGDTDRD